MIQLKFAPKTMDQKLFRFIELKTSGTEYEIIYLASFDTEPEDYDDATYVYINDTTLPKKRFTEHGLVSNTIIDFYSEKFNLELVKKDIEYYRKHTDINDNDTKKFITLMDNILSEYEKISKTDLDKIK